MCDGEQLGEMQKTVDALRAELAAAGNKERVALFQMMNECDLPGSDAPSMYVRCKSIRAELQAAQAQVTALKAVVEAVEWGVTNNHYWASCMWCNTPYPNHAPDCPRQAALGLAQKGGE